MRARRSGFTLIELLVVIAIVLVLAGLILAVVFRSQQAARRTQCASNLAQLGKALIMYCSDNAGEIPQTFGLIHEMIWRDDLGPVGHGRLMPYVNNLAVYYCPSATGITQGHDGHGWGVWHAAGLGAGAWSSHMYRNGCAPPGTALDGLDGRAIMMDHNYRGPYAFEMISTSHSEDIVNVLWWDGHVKGHPNGDRSLSIDPVGWRWGRASAFSAADRRGGVAQPVTGAGCQ